MKGFQRFDDLFWKYMLAYKKRTIFTILGITMAVILFFGAGTIYTSINHAIYETSKLAWGDYDAEGFVTAEECQKLRQLDYIEEMLLINEDSQSYIQLEEEVRINIALQYFEKFDQTIYHYELLEGRYPENDHELLLEQYQADYFGVKTGDTLLVSNTTYWYEGALIGGNSEALEFLFSHQEKEENGGVTGDSITRDDLEERVQTESCRVVGIYMDEGSDLFDFGLDRMTALSLINREESYSSLKVCVRFQNHKNHLRQLREEEGIFLDENSFVTAYVPGYRTSAANQLEQYILFMIAFIILFWISVLIIRNVFIMTMAERSRDYGILRCMGISQYRLGGLLRKEGFAMAVIACILGMGITVFAIEFGRYLGGFRQLLKLLGVFETFHVHISPWIAAGSIAFTFCAVLFSLLEPARQIGAMAPVDAVIGRAVIKKERIKQRKGSLIRRIFGVEGEYAYKNLLRNKGKFVSSIVGIVISVTGLVLSFNIMSIMNGVFTDVQPGQIFDAGARFMNDKRKTEADVQKLEADLLALESVETVRSFYTIYMPGDSEKGYGLPINRNSETPEYTDYIANGWTKEQVAELEPYLLEGSLDYASLQNNGVIICRHNRNYTYLVDEWVQSKPQQTDLQPGDVIWIPKDADCIMDKLYDVYLEDGTLDMSEMIECQVVAVVDYNPYPVSNLADVIFAKEFYQEHLVPSRIGAGGLDHVGVVCSEHYNVEEIYEFQKTHKGYYFSDDGVHEMKAMTRGWQQLILLLAGIMISIGALNIFNTLSSNISLRKQEFQIMSAIGMSRRQILKMLSLEGGLSAILGCLIGILLGGSIGCWLTMLGREAAPTVQYQVPWAGILLSVILALGITGISLMIARKDLSIWEE